MDRDDVREMLVNPFYAIDIEPELALEHEPLASEAEWVRANLKLMDEMGAQAWLERLLAVLQGVDPLNQDQPNLGLPDIEAEEEDWRRPFVLIARIALRRACRATGSMRSSRKRSGVPTLYPWALSGLRVSPIRLRRLRYCSPGSLCPLLCP